MNKNLTIQQVRLIIHELRQETEAIYKLVPQSKIEALEAKMKRLGIKVIK